MADIVATFTPTKIFRKEIKKQGKHKNYLFKLKVNTLLKSGFITRQLLFMYLLTYCHQ